jgi:integrase
LNKYSSVPAELRFQSITGKPSGDRGARALKVDAAPEQAGRTAKQGSSVSVTTFVALKFIPEHVERKSFAGRTHYQSILKHILRPETVDRLFNHGSTEKRTRLRAIPDWPYLDDVDLCELTSEHVRGLTSAAMRRGYSAQTVKHIRSVLGTIISHAKRERLFTGDNPVPDVGLPAIDRKMTPKLTIVQAKAMLAIMQSPEREMALITMTTGMNVSEICGLQWKHVNLTETARECDDDMIPPECILVKQHWNPEGIVNVNSNRIRFVDIPEPLFRVFVALKQEARSSDLDSFVLASPFGKPMCPASLRRLRLKPIGRKLQMPWISWQVLTRAHVMLLSELKLQLSRDLVLSLR